MAAKNQLVADLKLAFAPPFDAPAVLASYASHAIPGIEEANDRRYRRLVRSRGALGWFDVVPMQRHIALRIWNVDEHEVEAITARVRAMLGLDAAVGAIAAALGREPTLAGLWKRFPGTRVARRWSPFETVIATILGQLVSVGFGRTLTRELMHAAGKRVRHPTTNEMIQLFPTPKQVLRADLSMVRTSSMRKRALRELAARFAEGTLREHGQPISEVRAQLRDVPGVGAWTTEYASMFAFHDDDAFPATDYVLKQELGLNNRIDVRAASPYRSYAAVALWRNFAARTSS